MKYLLLLMLLGITGCNYRIGECYTSGYYQHKILKENGEVLQSDIETPYWYGTPTKMFYLGTLIECPSKKPCPPRSSESYKAWMKQTYNYNCDL
jgi:hypothetical protein